MAIDLSFMAGRLTQARNLQSSVKHAFDMAVKKVIDEVIEVRVQ